eukprot:COSAG05_NODE_6912_length_882_cov_3.051086_1_plen_146_part_00
MRSANMAKVMVMVCSPNPENEAPQVYTPDLEDERPASNGLDVIQVDVTDTHTILQGTIDFLAPLLCLTKVQKSNVLKATYHSGIQPDTPWRVHYLEDDEELHAIVVFAFVPNKVVSGVTGTVNASGMPPGPARVRASLYVHAHTP